jgi:hypothetical protein
MNHVVEVIAKRRRKETARLQVIDGGKKKTRYGSGAMAMNQHIRHSIFRVVLDSELEIRDMRQVAAMFDVPQWKIIDCLRHVVRDLKNTPPPSGPARRAA